MCERHAIASSGQHPGLVEGAQAMGMTGEVFEYFFEQEELEPFYSDLVQATPAQCQQLRS